MNIHEIDNNYDFEIIGASYIGKPRNNTVMFIGRKLASFLPNLETVKHCLVFLEEGISFPRSLQMTNCLLEVPNPSLEYVKIVNHLWDAENTINRRRRYRCVDGYTIGENVSIGTGTYVYPDVFIDHDVTIGDDCIILSGARISRSNIGSNCIIKQNAVIGGFGFVMTKDENNNTIRIPSMGKVVLGHDVEIGSFTTVCCGTGNNTIVEHNVKLDDHVHLGHDCHVHANTEIVAGSIVGGFVVIGESSFIGINASLRNRIELGAGTFVGMGAVVTKSFTGRCTLIGNPAHIMEKK